MTLSDEKERRLRAVKDELFGAFPSPAREYVDLLGSYMSWPVDSFARRSASAGNVEHHIVWIKGQAIGVAAYVDDQQSDPQVTATIRPLDSVRAVKLSAIGYDRGTQIDVRRSMEIDFANGDPIKVDVAQYISPDNERAEAFISATLLAVAHGDAARATPDSAVGGRP